MSVSSIVTSESSLNLDFFLKDLSLLNAIQNENIEEFRSLLQSNIDKETLIYCFWNIVNQALPSSREFLKELFKIEQDHCLHEEKELAWISCEKETLIALFEDNYISKEAICDKLILLSLNQENFPMLVTLLQFFQPLEPFVIDAILENVKKIGCLEVSSDTLNYMIMNLNLMEHTENPIYDTWKFIESLSNKTSLCKAVILSQLKGQIDDSDDFVVR